jgi:hypothetical protein
MHANDQAPNATKAYMAENTYRESVTRKKEKKRKEKHLPCSFLHFS